MISLKTILESGMLICWGASWPFQVAKTYQTKNVEGKSILFVWLILTGYILAMIYKTVIGFDWVFWLYLANFVLILADMILYYMYKSKN